MHKYRKARDGDMSLFEPTDDKFRNVVEGMRNKSPEEVSFPDLECISREHPEEALALWEEIKATARQDIGNGWHAARGVCYGPWERSCYFAIREQFHELFPPRNGVESLLLDELAQYEMLRRGVIESFRYGRWSSDDKVERDYPRRTDAVQSLDRLQRLFQYTLRTLINLRRIRSPVVLTGPSQPKLAACPRTDASPDTPNDATTTWRTLRSGEAI